MGPGVRAAAAGGCVDTSSVRRARLDGGSSAILAESTETPSDQTKEEMQSRRCRYGPMLPSSGLICFFFDLLLDLAFADAPQFQVKGNTLKFKITHKKLDLSRFGGHALRHRDGKRTKPSAKKENASISVYVEPGTNPTGKQYFRSFLADVFFQLVRCRQRSLTARSSRQSRVNPVSARVLGVTKNKAIDIRSPTTRCRGTGSSRSTRCCCAC